MKSLGKIRHKLKLFKDIVGPYKSLSYFLFFILCLSAIAETLSISSVMPLLYSVMQGSTSPQYSSPMGWANELSEDNRLIVASGFVVGIFFFRSLLTLVREFYVSRFTNSLRHMWSTRLFENFLFGDLHKIRKENYGQVINSIVNEPVFAAKGINALIDTVIAILMIVVIGAFLLWLSFWMTFISFLIVAGGISLIWRLSLKYSENVGKRRILYNQNINHLVAESVTGIRQIKVFSAERLVLNVLDNYVQDLMKMMNRFTLFNITPRSAGEFLIILLIVVSICAAHFIFKKDLAMLLPEATVFTLALIKLFSMSSLFLSKQMEVSTYWSSVTLVNSYMSGRREEQGQDYIEAIPLWHTLSVQDVAFRFQNGPSVLSSISVNLKKGMLVGLVGRSGSGKSTFCDILSRLILPTSGQVFVDGQPLASFSRFAWRQRMGYVSQDPFLFHASIRDNIKLGNPFASDEDVVSAAEAAHADMFINDLPGGYDAIVGLGGLVLSGGQKQRISLAQAFLRRPDILVLDESTSGLDLESESLVLNSLNTEFRDSLVILVTHRLRSLANVDLILFMENGTILESGTFDDLIQLNGLFCALLYGGIDKTQP